MDLSEIAKKLGLWETKHIIRKAAELRRLCDVQFDSSVIGVGEVCKAIICLEIAATSFQVIFDRQAAIRLSGMSEKAYNRSFNSLQNTLGVKTKLDIRELGIQFGCIRLIPFVKKGIRTGLLHHCLLQGEQMPTSLDLCSPQLHSTCVRKNTSSK